MACVSHSHQHMPARVCFFAEKDQLCLVCIPANVTGALPVTGHMVAVFLAQSPLSRNDLRVGRFLNVQAVNNNVSRGGKKTEKVGFCSLAGRSLDTEKCALVALRLDRRGAGAALQARYLCPARCGTRGY